MSSAQIAKYGPVRRRNSDPLAAVGVQRLSRQDRAVSGISDIETTEKEQSVGKRSDSMVGSLRRSKSMASLKQSIRVPSMKYDYADTNPDPVETKHKRHHVRHLVGFRTFNQIPIIVSQIERICCNVETLYNWPKLGIEFTLSQIDEYLTELQTTQNKYYKLGDKLTEFDELCHEIDFLKRNLEKCVRNSISIAQRRVDSLRGPSSPAYLLVSDLSGQTWNDHNELRGLVCELTNLLKESNDDPSSRKESLQKAISRARLEVKTILQKSPIRGLLEAKQDLAQLNEERAALEMLESSMSQNLQRHQVVAGVMLTICREAKTTIKLLKTRIRLFESKIDNKKSSDVAAERIGLLDFIENARTYEREQKEAQKREAEEASPSENSFFLSSPKRLNQNRLSGEKPVWATTWSPSTKLLKKK